MRVYMCVYVSVFFIFEEMLVRMKLLYLPVSFNNMMFSTTTAIRIFVTFA